METLCRIAVFFWNFHKWGFFLSSKFDKTLTLETEKQEQTTFSFQANYFYQSYRLG
jgi:hypothetical protein